MKTKNILTVLALSTLLLTGCGLKNNDAIIKVNNEAITQQEFDETINTLTHGSVQDKQNPLYLIAKDRVVNDLIVKKLLEQEIKNRNITVTKEEEDKEIKQIVDKLGSKDRLIDLLKENNVSNEKFKKDLVNSIKMNKLVAMLGSTNVSDGDVKAFYKAHPEKFKTPERVRASHILISANEKEIATSLLSHKGSDSLTKDELEKKISEVMNEKKVKAEKILAEVNPNNFSELAKKYSEDIASGQKGGDLGFFAYADMVEPFSKAAFSLKPNKVSNLVKTDYGYHIIMVTDRAKAGNINFDQAKDSIKQYLEAENKMKLLEGLIVKLKNNAKIEFVNAEYKPQKIQEKIKTETNNK